MIKISTIPQEWKDVLELVQKVDPLAIIASGCLRDLYYKKPIKDVDIFVSYGMQKFVREAINSCDTIEGLNISTLDEDQITESAARTDSSVSTVDTFGQYQFIYCLEHITPAERFKHFDFGLCQIAFDGKQVIITDHFEDDVFWRNFTLLRADNLYQLCDSISRYQRFKGKYADFPLIIPHTLTISDEILKYGKDNMPDL